MDKTLLGIVRKVDEEKHVVIGEAWKTETSKKTLWGEDFPEFIVAVLQEFDDVFP